jgi:hypothetical protein
LIAIHTDFPAQQALLWHIGAKKCDWTSALTSPPLFSLLHKRPPPRGLAQDPHLFVVLSNSSWYTANLPIKQFARYLIPKFRSIHGYLPLDPEQHRYGE